MVDTGQRRITLPLQFFLAVWIIGAQVFYFYQLAPAIGALLRAFSRRVWH